jgi:type IX secretion system PorP/SprF family membrane protein
VNFQHISYDLDFYRLIFPSQNVTNGTLPSPTEVSPSENAIKNIDAGTSCIVYNETMWFGGDVDHLFRPNQSFFGDNINLPIKYTVFGGMQIARQRRLLKPSDETFSVAFLYQQQADYRQLNLGLYWYKVPIVMGVWYRGIPAVNSPRGDAVSFLLGLKFRTFSIGYSYDFTISSLINSTNGAHELSVIYEFYTSHRKKRHAIPCPEF